MISRIVGNFLRRHALNINTIRFYTISIGSQTYVNHMVSINSISRKVIVPQFCFLGRSNNVITYRREFSDYPEHMRVTLPALSPTMETGTIVSWEKKEGDKVSEGDLLCEIETDKATMGFETPEEGYIARILLPAGSKDIPIGQLLCIIVDNEDAVTKFSNFVDDATPTAQLAATTSQEINIEEPPPPPSVQSPPINIKTLSNGGDGSRSFASPAAKLLAAQKGIDISQISQGSGMDGMITSQDVSAIITTTVDVPVASLTPLPAIGAFTDIEMTNMRKTIAKRLSASKAEIPHYYLTIECEMDALLSLRAQINEQYETEGIKLSVNDFIIKATALACKKVPACNSSWHDTYIRQYNSVDLCVAVDTKAGLITPIVFNADTKGLAEISQIVKELAAKAKEGKLQPHEFVGGTITVSNLGMLGIKHFTAIINPPQSCILAVGTTVKKPHIIPPSGLSEKNVMCVTLSSDHRVVDGAVGAQWLKHFKKYLEQPSSMLL